MARSFSRVAVSPRTSSEWVLVRPGDVNGDGHADIVAGAPRLRHGPGRVRVLSGKNGETLLLLAAEVEGDGFGRECTGVGDFDRDGVPELLVGAPKSKNEAGQEVGRAYLYSGKDGDLLQVFEGEEGGDRFGSALDGIAQGEHRMLVIGAGDAGRKRQGRAYIYRWEEGSAKLIFRIEAARTGRHFAGDFVSFVGDVDADGTPDVYAADLADGSRGCATGRVVVYSGATGRKLHDLTGRRADESFGGGSGRAGDVNRDGHDDLLIGAYTSTDGAPSAGKVVVISGKDGRLLKEIVCTGPPRKPLASPPKE